MNYSIDKEYVLLSNKEEDIYWANHNKVNQDFPNAFNPTATMFMLNPNVDVPGSIDSFYEIASLNYEKSKTFLDGLYNHQALHHTEFLSNYQIVFRKLL